MDHAGHILLFDGVCNLCNGLVKFIIRHDREKKIEFAPLQSRYAELVRIYNPGIEGSDSVIYLTDGRYFMRSTAILKLLRDMGKGWKLFYGLIIIPRFIRDYIYNLIARNRYRIFGKRESCMVPTPEIKDRFLE